LFSQFPKYTPQQIKEKRKKVADIFAPFSFDPQKLDAEELERLFWLYDRVFLNNLFAEKKAPVRFSISSRMSKSAGKTILYKSENRKKAECEIRLGLNFLLNFQLVSREKKVNGIVAWDELSVCQLVLEHEICHVFEFFSRGKTSCKGAFFRQLAWDLFGHSEQKHRLVLPAEIAREKFGLSPGERVCFTYKGREMCGFFYRAGQRATIMVEDEDGNYFDSFGRSYSKYYLPYERLQKRGEI